MKRKKHYNEFQAVKLARKLMEQDREEDEEEADKGDKQDGVSQDDEGRDVAECMEADDATKPVVRDASHDTVDSCVPSDTVAASAATDAMN